jgi:crotonobetainyl-CoA:carnitine CoA-transferase CaiB-like acyl-CoA transferase
LYGGYFASVNRNKRSTCLDLTYPDGRRILLDLLADTDVLVENFRVGVMGRFGPCYKEPHARYPKLVYASIRGFGDPRTRVSPYVDWPAFDIIAQAMRGIMSVIGTDAEHPVKVGSCPCPVASACRTGPVNTASDIAADPHVAVREMIVEVEHPSARRIDIVGSPIKMSETPAARFVWAPLLGEHNAEVIGDCGTVGSPPPLPDRNDPVTAVRIDAAGDLVPRFGGRGMQD